jgi:hypothetical protein
LETTGILRGSSEAWNHKFNLIGVSLTKPPTYFLQMVVEHGGFETARRLLHARKVSDGFTTLWENGRLDLSVEAVVLQEPWSDLFTDEELTIAEKRLRDLGQARE